MKSPRPETLRSPLTERRPRSLAVLALALLVSLLCLTARSEDRDDGAADQPWTPRPVPPLSPEESMATIRVPDGYRLELVASEPRVEEPVAIAWDGNGRLYVAEMRTYMQDIDGRDQLRPVSRVSRLEDRDGDGHHEHHTVFIDGLVLPRMILPLADALIVRETNTLDLWHYRDTNGDGVADEKRLWHEGGPRGGNLEHQPSGLVWALDNWIYTTYSAHRYRYTRGHVEREPLSEGSGQWGLAQDDVGVLFYSTAGGETPAMDFQLPIVYGKLRLPGEYARGFQSVFPLVRIPDVQGGHGRHRRNGTLNHFTGCAGQTIYRGDRLPEDLRGDLIIPEPVGRLVRRAKVREVDGKRVLENAYEGSEFIVSTDPNFRPLNSATGPDGCLYLVDMYRGIIQEGNWVREGSYLRGVVEAYALQENIGRGRIYRLVHEKHEPGPQPRLLERTPDELIETLAHPNGWWRDTSQQLLILAGDRTVVPRLETVARSHPSALARLHALWTLEGLDAVTRPLLLDLSDDEDSRVRGASIRVAEPWLARNDPELLARLTQALRDPEPRVALQSVASAQLAQIEALERFHSDARELHGDRDAVRALLDSYSRRLAHLAEQRRRAQELREQNEAAARSYEQGRVIYGTLCITCHGPDGRGAASLESPGKTLAPPLAGSERVAGAPDRLVRILLHGLTGPVDGQTYTELMIPMGGNGDDWIASVLNFARNSWGHRASFISPADVHAIRAASGNRRRPWTLAELHAFDPRLSNRDAWKLSASHNSGATRRSIDGNPGSRWDTGTPQKPGMWFQIDLPEPTLLAGCVLDTRGSDRDWPAELFVTSSLDGESWSEPIAEARPAVADPVTRIHFEPVRARSLRITQTGAKPGLFWSIHELELLTAVEPDDSGETPGSATPETPPLAELLASRGDATRGRTVFAKHCATCHKCGDLGVEFGPDLSDVGKRLERRLIIESLLEPAKVVEERFRGVMLQTARGEFLSGILVGEEDGEIEIRQQGGTLRRVARADLVLEQTQPGTFMPLGLERAMRPEELFDLIELLVTSRGE